MYPKYKTKSIVLRSYPVKEDDLMFVLLTEEFGLIHARAVSARKQESKLKHVLSLNLYVYITLVHGRSGWRLIEASELNNRLNLRYLSLSKIQKIASVFKFLLHYVPADYEKDKRIFKTIQYFLFAAQDCISESKVKELSIIAVHDVLALLGYLKAESLIYLEKDNLEIINIRKIQEKITAAIKNSQLHFNFDLL